MKTKVATIEYFIDCENEEIVSNADISDDMLEKYPRFKDVFLLNTSKILDEIADELGVEVSKLIVERINKNSKKERYVW